MGSLRDIWRGSEAREVYEQAGGMIRTITDTSLFEMGNRIDSSLGRDALQGLDLNRLPADYAPELPEHFESHNVQAIVANHAISEMVDNPDAAPVGEPVMNEAERQELQQYYYAEGLGNAFPRQGSLAVGAAVDSDNVISLRPGTDDLQPNYYEDLKAA